MHETNRSTTPSQSLLALPSLKGLGHLGGIALVYFLCARLSLAFVAQPENLAVVWPPSGVMLAALLLHPRRAWAGILTVIFLTNSLVNLVVGNAAAISLAFALANSLEGLVTAWLLVRSLGTAPTFFHLREVLALAVLSAGLGNGLTAFFGAAIPSLGFGAPYWDVWRVWWVADGLGILLITPLLVIWATVGRETLRSVNPWRLVEAAFGLTLLAALAQWIFGGPPEARSLTLSPPIITFPPLIWAVLRLGRHGAVTALLLLSVIAVWNTVHGLGPFAAVGLPTTQQVIAVQTFLAATIFSTLALAGAITERHQAAVALRQSERQTRTVIDSAYDAFIAMHSDGRITDWNRQAEAIFGWTREEALGRPLAETIIPPQHHEAHQQGLQRFLATGEARVLDKRLELTALHRSGKEFPVEITIAVNRIGDTSHFTAFLSDISERKQAEAEILKLNQELQKRVTELVTTNRELEAFSYSVSHDLRAPLRALNGYGQMLLQDYTDRLDNAGRGYLERICAASKRMGDLIDSLLELSRLSRTEMVYTQVDVSALARDIAVELQEAQPERAVAFTIDNGLVASGDARLLRVVLTNLIGNAWKFTRPQAHARIEFGLTQRDGRSAYFVRDNGVGIDMTYAAKLFGAFQRLHSSSEFEGVGIGLATVQRIIHRHGGQIWAEGVVNEGATFYFTL